MKILHIIASHLHKTGGIPVVLKDLSEAQNKITGNIIRVLSIKEEHSEIDCDYFDFLCKYDSLEQYLKMFNADLLIFHGVYYKEYINASRIARKLNYKYCIQPHGSFGKNAQNKSYLKKQIANNTLFKKYIKGAYAYIYLNSQEKADAIFHKQSIVVPNGCNVEMIAHDKCKTTDFFYLGRYDINHKGIDILLDAIDILDKNGEKLSINFYGDGDKSQKTYMFERIEKLTNIQVNINGPVYDEKKIQLMNKQNVMILTSRYEGMPMSILEALACGCPCLVTPGTNFANIIDENGLGWTCKLDSKEIALSILQAKKEYENRKCQYIEKCKKFVQQNYSWNKIAQVSIEKYTELVN